VFKVLSGERKKGFLLEEYLLFLPIQREERGEKESI
jgi:hypothetical protein